MHAYGIPFEFEFEQQLPQMTRAGGRCDRDDFSGRKLFLTRSFEQGQEQGQLGSRPLGLTSTSFMPLKLTRTPFYSLLIAPLPLTDWQVPAVFRFLELRVLNCAWLQRTTTYPEFSNLSCMVDFSPN